MLNDYERLVEQSLQKYYAGSQLFKSTRKEKKFMIFSPQSKWIHFGAKGYDDYYSSGKDEAKRKRFLTRNARWKNAPKYTPAHLSYWTLWN
jgi:hypothetical protein